MPPKQRGLPRQVLDQHALWVTPTGMGRDHNELCHWLAKVSGIGLRWDSRYHGPTDRDDNLHTVQGGYRLAGISPTLPCPHHFQAQCPRQCSYRSRHPVDKPILDLRMISLEYWPSALDSVPSTDRRAVAVSKQVDRAVSPGFLQLRAGLLSQTFATIRIGIQ